MTDTLKTLIFEHASARAQMVQLTASWKSIANNNPCPPAVQTILGQLLTASAMLSASLKFEGSLILQIHGDGPIRLLVAECNSRLGIRATVKMKENESISDTDSFQQLVNKNGKGIFALVLDPHNRQPGQTPYQGIVPLTGQSIGEVLETYMHHSEQLETRLTLNADKEHASGLMIQQMPTHGGHSTEHLFDPDGWNRLQAIANTLQTTEHLETSVEELAKRLFWEEEAQHLSERPIQFECSCSRHKVERMLINLGKEEIESTLQETNPIEIICDFCATHYTFNQNQCTQLFTTDPTASSKSNNTLH